MELLFSDSMEEMYFLKHLSYDGLMSRIDFGSTAALNRIKQLLMMNERISNPQSMSGIFNLKFTIVLVLTILFTCQTLSTQYSKCTVK